MSERACAVRHSHILSRKFPPFLGFLSVADRTTNETKCSLYECALREIPRLPVCRSRGTAVARKRQNDLLSGCQNCALTWRAARRKKLPTLRQCSGDTNPQKSGQDVGMSDRARSLRHSPPGQGFAPTPRQPDSVLSFVGERRYFLTSVFHSNAMREPSSSPSEISSPITMSASVS